MIAPGLPYAPATFVWRITVSSCRHFVPTCLSAPEGVHLGLIIIRTGSSEASQAGPSELPIPSFCVRESPSPVPSPFLFGKILAI